MRQVIICDLFIVAFLQNTTIEYLSESVCVRGVCKITHKAYRPNAHLLDTLIHYNIILHYCYNYYS